MPNTRLTNAKWKWILEFLRSEPSVYVKDEAECRKFIEAVVWINRTGASWRDLPEKFGKSNSVFKRFSVLEGKESVGADAPALHRRA